jgi:hypothetical protein
MSDATDRMLFGRTRLADASAQQHESGAEAARAYADDILQSDPLALNIGNAARRRSVSVSTIGAIASKRLPRLLLRGSASACLVCTADVDAFLRDSPVPCRTSPQVPTLPRPAVAIPTRAEEETFLRVGNSSKRSMEGCND